MYMYSHLVHLSHILNWYRRVRPQSIVRLSSLSLLLYTLHSLSPSPPFFFTKLGCSCIKELKELVLSEYQQLPPQREHNISIQIYTSIIYICSYRSFSAVPRKKGKQIHVVSGYWSMGNSLLDSTAFANCIAFLEWSHSYGNSEGLRLCICEMKACPKFRYWSLWFASRCSYNNTWYLQWIRTVMELGGTTEFFPDLANTSIRKELLRPLHDLTLQRNSWGLVKFVFTL